MAFESTKQAIDEILMDQEGLRPNQSMDKRRSCKRNGQRAMNRLWDDRNWWFTVKYNPDLTIGVGAGGRQYISFNRDFVCLPQQTVISLDNQLPLGYRPRQRLEQEYIRDPSAGTPMFYTDPVMNPNDPGFFLVHFYKPFPSTTGHTVTAVYKRVAPILWDFDDPDTPEPPEGDEIKTLPAEWHATLYELWVYYQMKDKGNSQAAVQQRGIMDQSLLNMQRNCAVGMSVPTKMPPFGAGRALV